MYGAQTLRIGDITHKKKRDHEEQKKPNGMWKFQLRFITTCSDSCLKVQLCNQTSHLFNSSKPTVEHFLHHEHFNKHDKYGSRVWNKFTGTTEANAVGTLFEAQKKMNIARTRTRYSTRNPSIENGGLRTCKAKKDEWWIECGNPIEWVQD